MQPMENARLKQAALRPNGNGSLREERSPSSGSETGMILLDLSLKPIAVDKGAAAILNDSTQPRSPETPFAMPKEVLDVIRSRKPSELTTTKTQFAMGKRKYSCRTYLMESQNGSLTLPILALHFERDVSSTDALTEVTAEYHLTAREQEALRGISIGLTSKELAERMNISPNTVKAFLRLIMIKMGVTTRAGIVAKLLEHNGRS